MTAAARAHLEDLLRAKKLDVTLTSAAVWRSLPEEAVAPTGLPALDEALGGGLRRGHLSEIVGSRSSGRTSLLCRAAAAATSRGEVVAIVDTHDRFDPETAVAAGVDPARLLWVRDTGDAARALKAVNLCSRPAVLAWSFDPPTRAWRPAFPLTTWMRRARVEAARRWRCSRAGHLSRSPGGVMIALELPQPVAASRWRGASDVRGASPARRAPARRRP